MTDKNETVVAHAARWLDEAHPDWYKLVDPDTLDMLRSTSCVGGQLGVTWNLLAKDFSAAHSFTFDTALDVFATYTDLWKAEVRARRSAHTQPVEKTYTLDELRQLSASGQLDELLNPRYELKTELTASQAAESFEILGDHFEIDHPLLAALETIRNETGV